MEELRELRARLAAVEGNDPTMARRVRDRISELERAEAAVVREDPAEPVERRPAPRGSRRVKA